MGQGGNYCQFTKANVAISTPGTLWNAEDEAVGKGLLSTGQESTRTSSKSVDSAWPVLSFRNALLSLPFTLGCYQKNLSAGCIHLDHGIIILGHDWLVLVDAYSKYPCMHMTCSTSTRATTELLEQDFSYFGYSNTLVQ